MAKSLIFIPSAGQEREESPGADFLGFRPNNEEREKL